jgi:poly(A)-specific ribonuclease
MLASKVVESIPTPTDDALGFTRVIKFIADLHKPMISHNGIMDLMFLYDKFYHPLPETLSDFKAHLHKLFPHIYDTKHMINTRQELQQIFPNSMLSECYLRTQKDDF